MPLRRRLSLFIEREVLDIDVIFREIEVWLVLATLASRRSNGIRRFILEFNRVLGQVVRDEQTLHSSLTRTPLRVRNSTPRTYSPYSASPSKSKAER